MVFIVCMPYFVILTIYIILVIYEASLHFDEIIVICKTFIEFQ